MKIDWKQVTLVLALGIAIGSLGTLRLMPFGHHGLWQTPEKIHQHILAEFTSKLKLTPDQQQKVSAILDDTRSRINALRQEVHPKFEVIRNTSKAQIRELLTPDQQKTFDVMSAKMDARRKKQHPEWLDK